MYARRASQILNKPAESLKIVTVHLGNGCSMSAHKDGIAVDTSMGFTPLEGLVMGTRCGDIDPAIILNIMGREELSLHEANTLLNKHSGLQGVSGVSSDMRDILTDAEAGNEQAKLALDIYCYRIRKYIGAYAAGHGRCSIASSSPPASARTRLLFARLCCHGLDFLGADLDQAKNPRPSRKRRLSPPSMLRVKVLAIPTNEELDHRRGYLPHHLRREEVIN